MSRDGESEHRFDGQDRVAVDVMAHLQWSPSPTSVRGNAKPRRFDSMKEGQFAKYVLLVVETTA